jgi:hypothetical protein
MRGRQLRRGEHRDLFQRSSFYVETFPISLKRLATSNARPAIEAGLMFLAEAP